MVVTASRGHTQLARLLTARQRLLLLEPLRSQLILLLRGIVFAHCLR